MPVNAWRWRRQGCESLISRHAEMELSRITLTRTLPQLFDSSGRRTAKTKGRIERNLQVDRVHHSIAIQIVDRAG